MNIEIRASCAGCGKTFYVDPAKGQELHEINGRVSCGKDDCNEAIKNMSPLPPEPKRHQFKGR